MRDAGLPRQGRGSLAARRESATDFCYTKTRNNNDDSGQALSADGWRSGERGFGRRRRGRGRRRQSHVPVSFRAISRGLQRESLCCDAMYETQPRRTRVRIRRPWRTVRRAPHTRAWTHLGPEGRSGLPASASVYRRGREGSARTPMESASLYLSLCALAVFMRRLSFLMLVPAFLFSDG